MTLMWLRDGDLIVTLIPIIQLSVAFGERQLLSSGRLNHPGLRPVSQKTSSCLLLGQPNSPIHLFGLLGGLGLIPPDPLNIGLCPDMPVLFR